VLTEDEKQKIEAEAAHHLDRRAVASDALRVIQRRHGWVSDELLRDVAEFLGMTTDELDSVATFYNLIYRRPVGRHVILICDSAPCWIMGYDRMREHLARRLGVGPGQTTPDGRFTLLPAACLGACDHAPAMMIDEDLHGYLTSEKVDQILSQYE
jgi:NADH-quinone oxidoreductase subunit E